MRAWPLVVLLVAQVLYLLAEVGFNAALLNVASGATGTLDQIDSLEVTGRVLAGAGLALLFIGALMARPQLSQWVNAGVIARFVFWTALLVPLSVWIMWHLQIALIDRLVVDRADRQERFAASYVQHLAPAIRQGVLGLDHLPITSQDLDRTDIKTLLTLLGPALMTNQRLVEKIADAGEDIVKFGVHSRSASSLDEAYHSFLTSSEAMAAAWSDYEGQVKTLEADLDAEVIDLISSREYSVTVDRMETVDNLYRKRERDLWETLDRRVEQTLNNMHNRCSTRRGFGDQFKAILSFSKMDRNLCYLDSDQPTRGRNAQRFYSDFGFYPTFEDYCPRWQHSEQCLSPDQYHSAARKTWSRAPEDKKQDFFDRHQRYSRSYIKQTPPGLSTTEMFNHPSIKDHLQLDQSLTIRAGDIQHRTDRHGNAIIRAEGLARRIVVNRMEKQLSQGLSEMIAGATGTRLRASGLTPPKGHPHLGFSHSQFMRNSGLQRAFFEAPLSSTIVAQPLDSVSRDQFYTDVVLVRMQDTVAQALQSLPASPATVNIKQSDQALRAIYVPAIALAFSLFFSVLNALSVLWRALSLLMIYKPHWEDIIGTRRIAVVKFFGLVAILNLPLMVPDNQVFQSQVMQQAIRASDLHPAAGVVDWVVSVQPVIFPIGHAAVALADTVRGTELYDERAHGGFGSEAAPVDAVDLNIPLSVESLQEKLQVEGLYRGRIDGIIGPNTVAAIKAFQRQHELPVTGVQDPDTIAALNRIGVKRFAAADRRH